MGISNFEVLRLVRVNSVLVRKTLVTLLLARIKSVNIRLVLMSFASAVHRLEHMTFVKLLLVRMTRSCPNDRNTQQFS